MKTIIERGASWCVEETRLLLSLWGEDLVLRQASNTKRTKECYERIAEKLLHSGFERTAEQVRTRVFNMIAEYRRILKDPNSERQKKCVFFEPLHKIYQAKHMDDVKSALDDYEAEGSFSPNSAPAQEKEHDQSTNVPDNELNLEIDHPLATNNSSIQTSLNNNNVINNSNAHNKTLPATNVHSNDNGSNYTTINNDNNSRIGGDKESTATNSNNTNDHNNTASGAPQAKKLKVDSTKPQARSGTTNNLPSTSSQSIPSSYSSSTTAQATVAGAPGIASSTSNSASSSAQRHSLLLPRLPTSQLYQAPVNTFDVTSSALLIDRMFAHLAKESENMREWIALEKERLQLERVRRQQEADREIRRERIMTETLMKLQDQWLAFLSKVDPRVNDAQLESNLSQVESSQVSSEMPQLGSNFSSSSSSKLVVVEPHAGNGGGGDTQLESK